MYKGFTAFFILILLIVGTSFSQPPDEGAIQEETADNQMQAEPEPPKVLMDIKIEDGLMSVVFENADFGSALMAIADKAGFKVEGSSETFGKKLNTRFSGIEVERAVQRLFSLVKETNYMMHYGPNQAISKIDVYGGAASAAPAPGTRAMPATSQAPSMTRPNPPAAQRQFPRRFPNSPISRRPTPPAQQPPAITEEPEVVEEENVTESPYVPSPQRPQPFPSRRR